MYKNHTEIRINGYELCPFNLPKYVLMRLFALEYFKKMINSDLVIFSNSKKKAQLRIKNQLGPIVCNTREARREAEIILADHIKLQENFGWIPYDPNNFICDRRMKNKLSPYIHHRILEIEQFANMDEWREGTLIENDSEQVNIENFMSVLEKKTWPRFFWVGTKIRNWCIYFWNLLATFLGNQHTHHRKARN